MSTKNDWTTGAPKWAAVCTLGLASVVGVAWSIVTDARTPNEPAQLVAESDPTPDEVVYTIDINSASPEELELLPRIGPTLAARIVADREQNGAFADVEDLDRVHGIGPKTIAQFRDFAAAR